MARIDIGRIQIRPGAGRRFAILLYLSAEAGRRVPRRVLIDLLYPNQTERNGAHSLRELMYRLRSAGVPLRADYEGIELPADQVTADYAEALQSERLTLEQIRAAQGGFLPGYTPHESEAYREWYEPFRARMCSALSRVLLRDHGRARDVGNLERSEAAARACLVISPLNEQAVKALAETLALSGAKADALQLLEDYKAEVGVRSPELRLSAELMKRRIRERVPDQYRSVGELPFAGRDAEMLELRRRLAKSLGGSSGAVLIVGDAGIGKTRLLNEFASVAALENTNVKRLTAHTAGFERPMGVMIDLLPGILQLPGALGISPDSMDALRRVTSGRGIADPVHSLSEESEVISRAITRALHDLMSAISAETHLTVVLDDAHWADRASLRLLLELAAVPAHRLLLLAATRDRNMMSNDLWSEETSIIQLRALEHECVIELSRRCLRGTTAATDADLPLWMARIAQGNPLFLESLVAHYKTTGERFKVPASLHELLARRLSTLQDCSIAVLQVCVFLGPLSTERRLLDCLGMPFVNLVAALNELQRLRLIDADGDGVFPAHPLIAEVLQERSPASVLRLIHRKIAMTLEQEPEAHELPARLWDSAHHWAAAGEHHRALASLRMCADHAHRIGRPADAAAVLLKAATLEVAESTRIEILKDAVHAAQRAGEFDQVLEGVSAIRRLNPVTVHDDVELAELAALSVTFVDSVDFSTRVLTCLNAAEADSSHRVRVGLAALKYADTYSVPDLAYSVASAVSDSDLSTVDQLIALEFRMVCQAALGDPQLSVPYARELRCLAESHPSVAAVGGLFNAGHAFWRAGLVQDARHAVERAYDRAEQSGSARRQLSAAMQLAIMLCDQGNAEDSDIWRLKAHELRRSSTREFGEFEFTLFQLEFALLDRNLVLARKLVAHADQKGIFSSAIRFRWRRYIVARIRQLAGDSPIAATELNALLADSEDGSSTSGIREAEMLIICAALVAEGRTAEARDRLSEFFVWRSRYSRGAIPRQLQEVVIECGFGDLLSEQIAPVAWRTAVAGARRVLSRP